MTSVLAAADMSGWRWPCLRGPWRWSARADLGFAMVCFVLGQIEVTVVAVYDSGSQPVLVLSAALATLPIALRRWAPLAASVVVAASWGIYHLWGGVAGYPLFAFAAIPVLFSAGAHPNLKRGVVGLATMLAVVTATVVEDFGFLALQFAVVWGSGRAARLYRVQSESLRVLAQRLETEREVSERLALMHERQRIACELNDTIAHAISVMVLQAAGAGHMLSRQPNRARAALTAVQDNGRAVIVQLERVLRLLRTTAETSDPVIDPLTPDLPQDRWHPGLIMRSGWVDLLLALLVILFTNSELAHIDPRNQIPPLIAGSVVATFLAIMIRRRAPLTALLISTVTTAELLLHGREIVGSIVAMMLAMYSVAAHTATRRAVPAALIAAIGIQALALLNVGAGADAVITIAVWLGMPWFLGRHMRNYRHRARQLRTLTTRLALERDARARLAVLDERARLARDLHDSLAHVINVMVLQAGGAQQVLTTSPDRAREAIRAVESQGRQAHTDLRHLLGLLDGDSLNPRQPQPSLSQLDTLLDQARKAGVPVTLKVIGIPARLPADLDISAYRIVQEGLTNAVKHAGPVPTTITLGYLPEALDIEIRDVGTSQPPSSISEAGHGLLGMRERTTLYGGTLETGPCPGGGFVVRAHFPLDPVAS